jgi:hypothetical protein
MEGMGFKAKKFVVVLGVSIVGLALAYGVAISPHHSFAPAQSAEGLLDRADTLSWMNRWGEAKPLYAQAAILFRQKGHLDEAVYAEVSEIPADESQRSSRPTRSATPCDSTPNTHHPRHARNQLRCQPSAGHMA